MTRKLPDYAASRATQLVREVVRGERHWSDLRTIGVDIEEGEGQWLIAYAGDVCSTPDLSDVAAGLAAYRTRAQDLKAWAHIILGASAFLDFSGIESTPTGELLVEALWDAADSGEVSDASEAVVSQLLQQR